MYCTCTTDLSISLCSRVQLTFVCTGSLPHDAGFCVQLTPSLHTRLTAPDPCDRRESKLKLSAVSHKSHSQPRSQRKAKGHPVPPSRPAVAFCCCRRRRHCSLCVRVDSLRNSVKHPISTHATRPYRNRRPKYITHRATVPPVQEHDIHPLARRSRQRRCAACARGDSFPRARASPRAISLDHIRTPRRRPHIVDVGSCRTKSS